MENCTYGVASIAIGVSGAFQFRSCLGKDDLTLDTIILCELIWLELMDACRHSTDKTDRKKGRGNIREKHQRQETLQADGSFPHVLCWALTKPVTESRQPTVIREKT